MLSEKQGNFNNCMHFHVIDYKENDSIRDKKLAAVGITVKIFPNALGRQNIGYIMQELYNYIWQRLNRD